VDAVSLQYKLDRDIRLDLLEADPRRSHHALLTNAAHYRSMPMDIVVDPSYDCRVLA
jgi:hypothetical protein